ncbi:MAG: hypothetical protein LQ345_005073 [Seirophora villosa]|nr:MAG: hypothetical protein LQ345_005073 [Seirophora villosa]
MVIAKRKFETEFVDGAAGPATEDVTAPDKFAGESYSLRRLQTRERHTAPHLEKNGPVDVGKIKRVFQHLKTQMRSDIAAGKMAWLVIAQEELRLRYEEIEQLPTLPDIPDFPRPSMPRRVAEGILDTTNPAFSIKSSTKKSLSPVRSASSKLLCGARISAASMNEWLREGVTEVEAMKTGEKGGEGEPEMEEILF